MYAECYNADLDLYYTLRSELRGLTRSVDHSSTVRSVKEIFSRKFIKILQTLSTGTHSWVHDDELGCQPNFSELSSEE